MKSEIAKKVGIVGILLTCMVFAAWAAEDLTISIVIAPKTLNLQNQGQVVTVHTDIAYSLVAASEVQLEGVTISSWKADDRGNFVAKFLIDEIKALDLAVGEYNTLTLTGCTIYGDYFSGSAEILVIDNGSK